MKKSLTLCALLVSFPSICMEVPQALSTPQKRKWEGSEESPSKFSKGDEMEALADFSSETGALNKKILMGKKLNFPEIYEELARLKSQFLSRENVTQSVEERLSLDRELNQLGARINTIYNRFLDAWLTRILRLARKAQLNRMSADEFVMHMQLYNNVVEDVSPQEVDLWAKLQRIKAGLDGITLRVSQN